MTNRHNMGFTLIEVMIAVAIVAIVAAVALPMYTEQIIKTRRSDAKASLSELAQRQEIFFSDNNQYAASLTALNAERFGFTENKYSKEGYYTISIALLNGGRGFVMTATPDGDQAKRERDSGRCYAFTLDHLGRKGIDGAGANANPDDCW